MAIRHRPVLQHPLDHRISEPVVFLNKLNHAVRQLFVIRGNSFGLVKWNKSPKKKQFMFLFHWQRKPIDNTSHDLQQLGNTIEPLSFKYKAVEDVVDGIPNQGPVHHVLAINAVKNSFQILALAHVLGIKQLNELHHKDMVNVALGSLYISIR